MDFETFADIINGVVEMPSSNELLDFETFRDAITTAPLNDLYKYLDEDEEDSISEDPDDSSRNNSITSFDSSPSSRKSSLTTIHTDYDTDEEIDEGDGLETSGSDRHDSNDTTHDWLDERLDVDHSILPEALKTSHYLNPELQRAIDETEIVLEQLSIQAQSFVERQPLSTQIILAHEAKRKIFEPYSKHGSQAQFSASVMRFLSGGDTVRHPGAGPMDERPDGKLRFAEVDPVSAGNEAGQKRRDRLKRRADDDEQDNGSPDTSEKSAYSIKIPKTRMRETAGSKSAETLQSNIDPVRKKAGIDIRYSDVQENSSYRSPDYGPELWHENAKEKSLANTKESLYTMDPTKLDVKTLDEEKDAATILNASLLDPSLFDPTHPDASSVPVMTPLVADFSNVQLRTPTAAQFSMHSANQSNFSTPPIRYPTNYACSVDPTANAKLSMEAYNPVSLRFIWPATLRSSGRRCMPTPEYLDTLNRVLHLANAEARFTLSYFVRKYDTPTRLRGIIAGTSSNYRISSENEPPHALFRLGISQYLHNKIDTIVNPRQIDELGLTPEVRRILGQVWEEQPNSFRHFADPVAHICSKANYGQAHCGHSSKQEDTRQGKGEKHNQTTSGLNPLEKALLSRACDISVQTLDAYWSRAATKTKAWSAMKVWCHARDLEKVARAKSEGTW